MYIQIYAALSLKSEFNMSVSVCDVWVQVRGQLEVLRGACREVQGSQNFTTLLRAILALGNHLNEGTHKGNASGHNPFPHPPATPSR